MEIKIQSHEYYEEQSYECYEEQSYEYYEELATQLDILSKSDIRQAKSFSHGMFDKMQDKSAYIQRFPVHDARLHLNCFICCEHGPTA